MWAKQFYRAARCGSIGSVHAFHGPFDVVLLEVGVDRDRRGRSRPGNASPAGGDTAESPFCSFGLPHCLRLGSSEEYLAEVVMSRGSSPDPASATSRPDGRHIGRVGCEAPESADDHAVSDGASFVHRLGLRLRLQRLDEREYVRFRGGHPLNTTR
jgi:hypothetical protein